MLWGFPHYFTEQKQSVIALLLGFKKKFNPMGETPATHWYWFLSSLQLLVKTQFLPVIIQYCKLHIQGLE